MFRTSLVAVAVTLVASPALAQDADRDDDIVIVATRTPEKLTDTAAPVSIVTAHDFDDRQSGDIYDVLRLQPGLNVGGGPRAQGEIPAIRGFTGRQIIVTVDGARRNTTETLRAPLLIDPSFLRQIETLRGANSAVYGAGGLGGVLALETVSVESQLEPGKKVGARAFAGYESGAEVQRYGGQVYGRAGAVDALFAAAFRDSGPIRQGGGTTLRPEDSNTKSWLAKVGVDLGGGFRVQGSQQYFAVDDYGPNNPQANAAFPFMQAHRTTQNESVVNLTRSDPTGAWLLLATLYRTQLRIVADDNPATTPPLTGSDGVTRTTGGSLQSTFGFELGALRNKLTIGGDVYEERDRSTSAGVGSTITPDGRQVVVSAFAQDELTIARWLSITPVVRWDKFTTSLDSGASPDKSSDRVSAKGTLAVRPVAGLLAFASYGEAFRAPTVSELYQDYSVATSFANFRPNRGLRPEIATDLNLGAAYAKRGLFTADDRLSARFTWYRSFVGDLITSVTVGTYKNPFLGTRPILQYQNVSRARRNGIEAELDYAIGPVDFSAAYSRVRSVDRDSGTNLFSPPDKVNLSAALKLFGIARLRWNSLFVSAQDYDTTVLRQRPSYDVHDVFLSLAPKRWPVRADVGVTNIFDERYALYKGSTAYPDTFEEGRSVRLMLSGRF
ncbi:MAG: TonB-dependent receptor [Sphingomonas sp.]|jgi:hemoglobin/transferrin/lactoferrin receptor protein|uniref:TonB-dependent receptor domain-containing protein n=1 Tax=Sphingomonas sp. TaxID=28214 RepID=UPI0035690DBB